MSSEEGEGRMDDVTIDESVNEEQPQQGFDFNDDPTPQSQPAPVQRDVGTILPRIFSNFDRNQRYKIMLDVVPTWVIVVYLLCVMVFLMAVAGIALFAIPTAEKFQTKLVPYDAEVFTMKKPVVFEFDRVSPFNLEGTFSFFFSFNSTGQGDFDVTKDDFELGVKLEGANLRRGAPPTDTKQGTPGGSWDTLTPPNAVFKRYLECRSERYTYYFTVPGPNGDILKLFDGCGKISLFHLAALRYSNYRVTLTMNNANDLYTMGLIKGDMIADLQLTNENYAFFEIILRTFFGLSSIIFFFYFLFFAIRCQNWKKWHTTQKWLPVFLFLQIFYHDPIYSIQAIVGGEGWSIYHATGALAFIFSFLLYLIIFIHVVVTYLATLALFLWSAFRNVGNPAIVSIADLEGYGYMEIIVLCLILVYVGYVSYYTVRAVSHCASFRRKYSVRFIVIGAFSFFAVVSMLGVTVIQNRTRYTTEGATFLISHAIIYVYFGSLAHFFTPSGIPEPDREITKPKEEMKQGEGEEKENPFDDTHFQKETQPDDEMSIPPAPEQEMQIPRNNVELAEVNFDTIPTLSQEPEPMKATNLDSAFGNENFGFDEDPNSFPGDFGTNDTKIAEVHDQEFE